MKRNSKCNRCPLHENCRTTCLWGTGDPNADLMLTGEAPGGSEDRRGIPFCGDAGKLLDKVLFKLGLDRDDLYITNTVKCRPVDNKLPTKKAEREVCFNACWPYLEQELCDVDPKVVLLLGGTPIEALLNLKGITKHECMEVETVYEGAKTFASFHPAYILRSPSKEVRLAQAIARAAKVAGLKVKTKGWEAGMFPYEVRS